VSSEIGGSFRKENILDTVIFTTYVSHSISSSFLIVKIPSDALISMVQLQIFPNAALGMVGFTIQAKDARYTSVRKTAFPFVSLFGMNPNVFIFGFPVDGSITTYDGPNRSVNVRNRSPCYVFITVRISAFFILFTGQYKQHHDHLGTCIQQNRFIR
jgi:hypothetical protein